MAGLFGLGISAALLVASGPAAAGGPTTTTSPGETTTGTTTAGAPAANADAFHDAFWKIFLLAVLVALVWAIPFMLDIALAYWFQQRRMRQVVPILRELVGTAAEDEGLTIDELRALLGSVDVAYRSPRGITGLARTLFAFAVLATIATVLFALIAIEGSDDEIVKTIVTALVGAFTTIVGVYFGARTAESAVENAAQADAASPGGGGGGGDGGAAGGRVRRSGRHAPPSGATEGGTPAPPPPAHPRADPA